MAAETDPLTMKILVAAKSAGLREAADEVERRRRVAPAGSLIAGELAGLHLWLEGRIALAAAANAAARRAS